MQAAPLLTVENLRKHFLVKRGLFRRTTGAVRAVDGVSIQIMANECFGIVGESGCGKTTLLRCLMRLIRPDEGRVVYHAPTGDVDVTCADADEMMAVRRQMQIVFQDPFSSLDPRMSVHDIIAEPLRAQHTPRSKVSERVSEVLSQVGLNAAYRGRYPHELSGGQRQRVGIARALAIAPSVLLLDEPVSALDVSVRAQVLNLLLTLQSQMALTYVFITHDLSVVKHLSDRIAVMYLGQIVESGATADVFLRPAHPYTEALLASAPIVDPEMHEYDRYVIKGDVPSPMNPPPGCRFSTRCRYAMDVCFTDAPPETLLPDGRLVKCYLAEERTQN